MTAPPKITLVAACALGLASASPSRAETAPAAPPATIEAAGYAIAQGVPEFATLVFWMAGRGETEGLARQVLDDQWKAFAAFGVSKGIPNSDVFASGMVTVTRSRPLDWQNRPDPKAADWYDAGTTIRVVIRDLGAVKAFSDGAKITQKIYGMRDREALKQTAVNAAVAVATRNARRLAAGAGLSLQRIARVSDPSSDECEVPKFRPLREPDQAERVPVDVPDGLGPVEVCAKVLVTWSAQ